ncbi:Nucleotide-binding universal stress protein, UspA family [Arthrobacter sp. ok909]|uniref:universal stress protein n=1 Tax=Arthrobacter sp. ok909 TaxID=1761746 RepID=UPI00088BD79C|nr:universal stress protein [Arthrobacter sp. ok909]SDP15143.1 Nucleotide-binding universal stress protein, UspA family [Arthrobacter sp. ok909]
MSAPAEHQGGVVAVGYGGSEAARLAVRWAAGYAAATGLDLRVVHAWVWPVFTKNLGPVKGVAGSGLRHSAEAILAEGIELARSALLEATGVEAAGVEPSTEPGTGPGSEPREAAPGEMSDAGLEASRVERSTSLTEPEHPGPAVDGVMEAGLAAPVLREAARDARLLVVGSRGLGAVLGPVAGSVCLDLAGSAHCPVMVIRRPSISGGPVVVGVDASPRSHATLAEAVRLAGILGAPLHLVHVDTLRGGAREEHGRHARLLGEELLDHAIDEARALAPGLEVSGVLFGSHAAARELLAAAADADVLVLGTHNPSAGPGNTVSAVLHKARCNVLVSR